MAGLPGSSSPVAGGGGSSGFHYRCPDDLFVGGVRPKSGPETERDDKVLPLNMGWREASVKIRSPAPQKAEAT